MKKAVYIDDEPMLCRAIGSLLRGSVVTFTDPVAALAYVAEHGATVVICDYWMPAMTGLDVRARMTQDVPFYLISGELDAPTAPGVTGVLTKPIPVEMFFEIIERHSK